MDPEWLKYVRENVDNVKYTIERCQQDPIYFRNFLSSEFLVEVAPREMQNLVKTLKKCLEIVEEEQSDED